MPSLDDIAAQLQGYDPQALSVEGVHAFLRSMVQPLQSTETVPLVEALGRVLAQDIISPLDVPAHDNSAMDGYAFAGQALQAGHALTLRVAGTALAGQAGAQLLAPGQCLKVMTGAALPAGLDTVVPQELVRAEGGQVHIPADCVRVGDNRRLRGEDVAHGSVALQVGRVLTPACLGLVASLGLAQVHVVRRLRVAYFSTGDEILSLGEAPREGAVYDSNRYTVRGMLHTMGMECIDLGVVRDDPQALETAFNSAAAQADAIVTSGGVSVGEADHTKAMMRNLAHSDTPGEGGVAFWRIAMRPGRPMAVGRIGKVPLFGLPGNPVAVMVTFLAFVRPALWRMAGAMEDDPHLQIPMLQARSREAIRKKAGRTEYQRVRVSVGSDGRLEVQTTGQQGSGVLSSMVQANGLMVLEHARGDIAVGDTVQVMMFAGLL